MARPSSQVPGSSWYNTPSPIPDGGYAPPAEELEKAKKPLTTQPLRDLPINVVPNWDNVHLVSRALTDLEWGRFLSAALLADAMGRDDRIQGVIASRVNSLIGLPFEMRPADQTGKARKIAEDAEKAWPLMADEAQLGQILESGIMMGIGVAEKVWTFGETWTPHLRFWHSSFLYWRWDTRSYWLITQDAQIEVPEDGGGRFVVYAPYGYYRGWMKGRVRSLPLPWLIRSFARRDWARQSEVFGNSIKKAMVPQRADLADQKVFAASLVNLGSEALLECPVLEDGTKFDLELVEAEARTWESFEKLIGHAEAAISICLLGQNLTTEVKGGSKAAAQVHEGVKSDYTKSDATTLSRTIRSHMLGDWAQFNYGDRTLAPIPTWQVEPPEDVASKTKSLSDAATALKGFEDAGMPVDKEEFADEIGLPLIPENERPTIEEAAAEQAQKAKALADAHAALNPPEEDEDEPPKEEGEDDEEDTDPGEKAPAKKGKKAKLTSRKKSIEGAKRAQAYADKVTAKGIERAKGASLRRVELLMQVVHSAKSPADLKEKLVKAFDHPKGSELAELVEKATIMATLAGLHGVIEDL